MNYNNYDNDSFQFTICYEYLFTITTQTPGCQMYFRFEVSLGTVNP